MMMPRGRGHRYPPGRNMPDDGPMPGPFPPYDVNGVPLGQHMPAGTASLASSLAQASPAQQRTVRLLAWSFESSFKGLEKSKFTYMVCFLLGFV